MRCSECDLNPQALERHCECCGRQLSAEVPWEQERLPFGEAVARCGSCGGPAPDGELCAACHEAFSSVLGHAALTPAADAPSEPARFESPFVAPAPVESVEFDAIPREAAPLEAVAAFEAAMDAVARGDDGVPPMASAVAPEPVAQPVAAAAPTVAPAPPAASAKPGRNKFALAAVAAAAVAAVVGAPMGARWLGAQLASQRVTAGPPTEPPPVAAAKHPAVAHAAATSAPTEETISVQPDPGALPAVVVAAERQPAVAAARAPRAGAPRAAEPQPSAVPVVPVVEFSPMTVAPIAAPPPVAAAAPEPQRLAAPIEAPSGRLFDPSDVDEAPRVAARIEPQLPGGLTPADNDVVVVRVLVSHTGHPFRVNLLRRSRVGSGADEAVVAAVKQWTFTPARRRGEAVSCWFNVGVSLAK